MTAYYNEFDPFAAEWLRALIAAGHIAPGVVDTRSIVDVRPEELAGFTQCHFFAGIGVWSHALRSAGWSDERPVWTGSCPCQPFSAAGKGGGTRDERHLWPVFHRLIRACRPEIIMGEQVASSLVVGKFRGYDVQSLWQARQFLDFRKDWLEGHFPLGLQGVPEFTSAKFLKNSAAEHGNPCEQAGGRSEGESQRKEPPFRSGPGMGFGEAGSRSLPTEREAIRPDGDQKHEYAVSGPNRPKGRLSEDEHSGYSIRAERSARDLGAGQFVRSGGCCDEDAIERLNDLIAEVSGDIEAENGASWLDTLYLDLGRDGYTCWSDTAPAAGFGAPHIRQRLYWMAYTDNTGLERWIGAEERSGECAVGQNGLGGRMADAKSIAEQDKPKRVVSDHEERSAVQFRADTRTASGDGGRYDTKGSRESGRGVEVEYGLHMGGAGPNNGHWRDADWLFCRDGKWRPVESSTFPLAHGSPARVGRLRGYGNAIVAPQAAAFIEAVREVIDAAQPVGADLAELLS